MTDPVYDDEILWPLHDLLAQSGLQACVTCTPSPMLAKWLGPSSFFIGCFLS
jgi:hypothetical protein